MAHIARPLTVGELSQARFIFGASIDYDKVRIHNHPAYLVQWKKTAMAPDGNIYFNASDFKSDFSITSRDIVWLIHELVHCWQWQRGMWVKLRRTLHSSYYYGDLTNTTRSFTSFGIEQQADIVADYVRLRHNLERKNGSGSKADYERIIPFLPKRKK